MNAPFTPSKRDADRASLAGLVADVERWNVRLGRINRKEISDPDGVEGARLEGLIDRAQGLIASQATRLLGIDIARVDRARGLL